MDAVVDIPRALLADLGKAETLEHLLDAMQEHDNYSGGHSERVSRYSAVLARLLGLGDESVELVRRAGLVHDLGKLHVPREILRKYGPLTEAELALVKVHPIVGAQMVSALGHDDLAPIVLMHHERWDGRGYPTGASGIDIPLEARIIFVAGALDTMTSPRTYGEIVGTPFAIEEIERCAGWQFDPLVARIARTALEKGLL